MIAASGFVPHTARGREVRVYNYTPRGAAGRLISCRAPEVLLEGPAGTGKTRAVLEYDYHLCHAYPGTRVLWVRSARKHLNESVLATFENLVLPPGDPVRAGAQRSHRDKYRFENGSEIVVAGLDRPDRFRSAEFALIRVFEASEVDENAWEMLTHRLRQPRGAKLPFTQILADTNPDSPTHWLNLRADRRRADGSPMMVRLCSTHKDNPLYWDGRDWTPEGRAYVLDKLANLSGVRRDRYYLGRWSAAENAVWPEYSRAVHHVPTAPKTIRWHLASVDWGFRNPGVIHVYGIDGDGIAYLVHEVYFRERTIEWWTDVAKVLHRHYAPVVWVCDSENPEHIFKFRRAGLPTREAHKDVILGLELVRTRFTERRLFICDDSLDEIDPGLQAERKPVSVTQEIWAYCYPQYKDRKPIKELPAPESVDHGCDAMRYAVMYLDRYDHGTKAPKPRPQETQIEHWLTGRAGKAFARIAQTDGDAR